LISSFFTKIATKLMNTLFLGKHFLIENELPSTNTHALSLLRNENLSEGTVILARNQVQGKGQAGNRWLSVADKNLTFSTVLCPSFLALDDVFYLSKMTAIALREAVAELLPRENVEIKWANDLFINGKKAGGILIENQLEQNRLKYAIIGIGLNVNQTYFAEEIAFSATSLRQYAISDWDILSVCEKILQKMEVYYLMLRQGNKAELDQKYLAHLLGYGEEKWFLVGEEKRKMCVVGVEKSGRLATSENGKVFYFDIKEVKWLLNE
jgi:BirA family biotin operon repressor/biotin-[acetyl-CoA-carboxylase] ligase